MHLNYHNQFPFAYILQKIKFQKRFTKVHCSSLFTYHAEHHASLSSPNCLSIRRLTCLLFYATIVLVPPPEEL